MEDDEKLSESIGQAVMEDDGTIILQLRAETGSAVGDGVFIYKPSDPRYKDIKSHLGVIEPGDTVPVRPWDDQANDKVE